MYLTARNKPWYQQHADTCHFREGSTLPTRWANGRLCKPASLAMMGRPNPNLTPRADPGPSLALALAAALGCSPGPNWNWNWNWNFTHNRICNYDCDRNCNRNHHQNAGHHPECTCEVMCSGCEPDHFKFLGSCTECVPWSIGWILYL